MHEISIIESLIDTIEKYCGKNKVKKVLKVEVDAGKHLLHEDDENLSFIFKRLSHDTICENADLIVNMTEGSEIILKRIEGE